MLFDKTKIVASTTTENKGKVTSAYKFPEKVIGVELEKLPGVVHEADVCSMPCTAFQCVEHSPILTLNYHYSGGRVSSYRAQCAL